MEPMIDTEIVVQQVLTAARLCFVFYRLMATKKTSSARTNPYSISLRLLRRQALVVALVNSKLVAVPYSHQNLESVRMIPSFAPSIDTSSMAVRQSAVPHSAAVELTNRSVNKRSAVDQLAPLLADWIDRNCSTDIDTDFAMAPNRTNPKSVRFVALVFADPALFPSGYLKTTRVLMTPHRAIETMSL